MTKNIRETAGGCTRWPAGPNGWPPGFSDSELHPPRSVFALAYSERSPTRRNVFSAVTDKDLYPPRYYWIIPNSDSGSTPWPVRQLAVSGSTRSFHTR